MRSSPRRFAVIAVATALVFAGGCQVAKVPDSLVQTYGSDEPDAQLDFWHNLAEKPLASNDEATHALLLFLDGSGQNLTYDQRVALLKDRKLLPKGFSAPADEAVQRGVLAYALVEALKIRGGVTLRIFGNSQRYATKELVDMGLFPLSSTEQTFSGTELVGIFGRAEDYQRGGAGEKTPGGLAGNAPSHSR